MLRRTFVVVTTAILAACAAVGPPRGFEATVRSDLVPRTASIPDAKGVPQAVAASRDGLGVQSDFVEGMVLLRTRSETVLDAYLARFGGTVVRDNSIPELPARFGVQLTPEQRKATTYFIRIDPSRADLRALASNALAAGVQGPLEVSSQLGLLTLATVVNGAQPDSR